MENREVTCLLWPDLKKKNLILASGVKAKILTDCSSGLKEREK